MKKIISLLGAPGAGKGTQGELLAEKLSYYYFETSKILEDKFNSAEEGEVLEVEGKEYRISDEKNFWKTGKLCSPPFVSYLVKHKIRQLADEGKSLILSGSPRTLHEGEKLMPFLKELYRMENIKIVMLDITPEETIFRNSHRRICKLMRHPILFSEETKNLTKCPLDGSELIQRKGLDDIETIKIRLEEYKERTLPLIDYFKEHNLNLIKINGSPAPAVVFNNIMESLK